MSRTIAAILLIAVLAIGGGFIAVTAYQAGLGTAVTTAVADGSATVVAPLAPYGYGYGYGWHPGGFGFFGFLGTLFFLFLVFALIRAIFFRGGPGRGGWGRGWGGPGAWGNGDHGHGHGRFGEGFEEWHRRAHDAESSKEPPASNTTTKPA
jgi:hypothetical protein